jgi:hypothetical protein
MAGAMRDAGLEGVAGEAVISVGNRALQATMALTIARFAPALVAENSVAQADVDACLAALRDPDVCFTGSPIFSVWVRALIGEGTITFNVDAKVGDGVAVPR